MPASVPRRHSCNVQPNGIRNSATSQNCVVQGLGPAERFAIGGALDVILEGLALLDGTELEAEAQLRAQVDVGGAEVVAGDELVLPDGLFQRVEYPAHVAVADEALLLGLEFHAKRLVDDCALQRAGGKEQPAVVVGASIGRRRQAGIGERVCEVRADGGAFGDDVGAVNDCRHLGHRIDVPIFLGVHRSVLEVDGVVVGADFLEHPADHAAARAGIGVELDFGHCGYFLLLIRSRRSGNSGASGYTDLCSLSTIYAVAGSSYRVGVPMRHGLKTTTVARIY